MAAELRREGVIWAMLGAPETGDYLIVHSLKFARQYSFCVDEFFTVRLYISCGFFCGCLYVGGVCDAFITVRLFVNVFLVRLYVGEVCV